ncbi:MAG: acyclic terpene utilization AtuA family protein [Acidimicrobiales bacterium]
MRPIRIANCSGFYGDRLAAAREMVEGGPIDVLTGDYLAELTMLILWRQRAKRPDAGYASTFLRQLEDVLGTCIERGIRIVSNAGGLNPAGCATAVRALVGRLGLRATVAHIEGDDLLPQLADLQAAGHELAHLDTGKPLATAGVEPVTANAYLGGWGIAAALDAGADVVVCPRVTDASLVVGPAAWWHGWRRDDWDRLAGAVVAGHVLECGAQTTGGNYAFFREVPGLDHPGFPLAEVDGDGSSVITKHPGTGGLVSIGTVTAQLLYEIAGPAYTNPDVVARFDTIELAADSPDRVRIRRLRGEPAPATTKVCINYLGGWRNSVTFVLTGLDLDAKAELAQQTLVDALGGDDAFESVDVTRTGTDDGALLRITVKDADPERIGRRFSNVAVEMALASYPGFHLTAPPADASPYGVYWPALVPSDAVPHVVVLDDGTRIDVAPTSAEPAPLEVEPPLVPPPPGGPAEARPLGTIIGARSGDKGGNANVGLWARTPAAYAWLAATMTVERFRALVPDAATLPIERYELPNLLALNFVVIGLLGEGVASSTRADPQAKALGEQLRAQTVDIPTVLGNRG